VSPELHALAGAYALDALDDDERAAFEDHMNGCPDCAEEVRSLRIASAELSHISATPPPPQLRTHVLSAIKQVRPLPPVVDNVIALRQARATRSLWQMLAAACAVIAIAVSAWGYQQNRDARRHVAVAQDSAVDTLLKASDATVVTGPIGSGKATLVYSKSQSRVVLVGHGIPALAKNKTYQLWTISPDSAATSVGLFTPDAGGNVDVPAKADLAGAAKMGISIEPAGGSAQPTPGTVATMSLS
jgi:anti-sigma-K factor RskA